MTLQNMKSKYERPVRQVSFQPTVENAALLRGMKKRGQKTKFINGAISAIAPKGAK
jgi:hypothetical protein